MPNCFFILRLRFDAYEQITELSNNLYTYKVSKITIKFTDQFYDDFWKLYIDELPNKDILIHLGYNPSVLGIKRIEGIITRLRKER